MAPRAERRSSVGVEGRGPGHTLPHSLPPSPPPPPRRKWRPVHPAFLPVHSPPTSGGQVGTRRLTTFCADGRQAAASEWRPRPPAGGGGGAGGGLRSRAPRSSGPRSSSCSQPSWRGRPRQVRRRRRRLSSAGSPSRPAPQLPLSVVVIKCGDDWGGPWRRFPPPFLSSRCPTKFRPVCRRASDTRAHAARRVQPPPGNREGVGRTVLSSDVRLCENTGAPSVA